MLYLKIALLLTVVLINSLEPRKLNADQRRVNDKPYFRYTNAKCWSSNKSLSGWKCYIKSYSRTNTSINVFVNLTRPIYKAKSTYDLTYKYLTNSQRSIINSTLDLCEFLNGTNTNPIIKWILDGSEGFRRIVHPCPYTGNLEFKDIIADFSTFTSAFPAGTYITVMRFFDDIDDNIMTVKSTMDLISKDRNDF